MKCDACGATIAGDDLQELGDKFIVHVRAEHKDWPYPDVAVRNFAEASQRATGPKERLEEIGEVEIHPMTADRIDDWLTFFDRDAFPDNLAWAACYCMEPFNMSPGGEVTTTTESNEGEGSTWRTNRAQAIERFAEGRAFGYLAYVDGKAAAWVNASVRSAYNLYKEGDGATPSDDQVVGISCFVIAPPYRRHGLSRKLLDRVIADAPGRGISWVEGYPTHGRDTDQTSFRGPPSIYDETGFEPVDTRDRHTIVRRAV